MLCFQLGLLAGYGYAHVIVRRLTGPVQRLVHLAVMALSLAAVAFLVTRWGVPLLPDATWKPAGTEAPVWHIVRLLVVSVGAPGKRRWDTTVDASGEGATITVTVPTLTDDQLGPKTSPLTPTGSAGGEARDTGASLSRQRIGALVAAGVGLVSLGAGIGVVVAASSKYGPSSTHCNDASQCDAEGFQMRKEAIQMADAANVPIIAGAALLSAGAVLWLTAPRSASQSKTHTGLVVGPASLSFVGSF